MKELENVNIDKLYDKISNKIENTKRNITMSINNEMTILYWNIGKDITENIFK